MKFRSILLGMLASLMFVMPGMAQNKATKSLTLTVNPGTVVISPSTLPGGMVGLAYTATVSASGGLAPYTFSVSTGALPAGLSLAASTGIISGSPTASGPSTFTVQVADAELPAVTATQSYTVTIVSALSITTASLPAANIGVSYTATLAATGGVTPYTWAVTTGSLPSGLTLNSTTGVISGTPTSAGTFNFTITVTDSATNIVQLNIKAKIIIASLMKADNRS